MSRAIIADQSIVSNAGLCFLVSDALGFSDVTGLGGNSRHIVESIETHKPFLLVINIATVGAKSFDILKMTRAISPKTRTLIFDPNFNGVLLRRFLELGVEGYCTEKTQRQELKKAFKSVAHGKKYVCKTAASYLISQSWRPDERPLHEQFSARELQIFLMLGTGRSSSEIADSLHLSRQAVSTYRNRIYQKINLKSVVEIAAYIREHRLGSMGVE
jgi:two-component system invasion response regulator UvrY